MVIDFHTLKICLSSNDERILGHWRELFDYEVICGAKAIDKKDCDVQLDVRVVSALPPPPPSVPDYINDDPLLKVFNNERAMPLLRLPHLGQITWRLQQDPAGWPLNPLAEALITERAFDLIALDNLTTLALAPIFRRYGLFVIHAFAAAHDGEAVMFVGPSGSGKTSSGLALLAGGWQLLANDMALMRGGEPAHALLSPGSVQISPLTISLLPQFAQLLDTYAYRPLHEKVSVPRLEFLPCEDALLSAPLRSIFFPSVTAREEHRMERVTRAVGLARLMEFSMDQWDRERWKDHVAFLERLSRQVDFYWLYLGRNMAELAPFLASAAASKQLGRA